MFLVSLREWLLVMNKAKSVWRLIFTVVKKQEKDFGTIPTFGLIIALKKCAKFTEQIITVDPWLSDPRLSKTLIICNDIQNFYRAHELLLLYVF